MGSELGALGLAEVIRGEQNRLPDGTTRGTVRADGHRFRISDDGLKKPALPRVLKESRTLRKDP